MSDVHGLILLLTAAHCSGVGCFLSVANSVFPLRDLSRDESASASAVVINASAGDPVEPGRTGAGGAVGVFVDARPGDTAGDECAVCRPTTGCDRVPCAEERTEGNTGDLPGTPDETRPAPRIHRQSTYSDESPSPEAGCAGQ